VAPGPAARLVHPESMEEMSLALPAAAADAVEMLRGSSICRYISMDRSTGLSHHITSHHITCSSLLTILFGLFYCQHVAFACFPLTVCMIRAVVVVCYSSSHSLLEMFS
jgi:hypothetical protein